MNKNEIYEGLRLIVRTYIATEYQQELLRLLDRRESEGSFPPGKGILADMDSHSNGIKLKEEHKELYDDICHHCI